VVKIIFINNYFITIQGSMPQHVKSVRFCAMKNARQMKDGEKLRWEEINTTSLVFFVILFIVDAPS